MQRIFAEFVSFASLFMIIGHQNIISYLEKAVEADRLPHALIFEGPKNVGKTTVARWLASKLLNADEARLEVHPDFYNVIPDGTIGKEQIDGIISKLQFTSFSGGYKVAVVEDAHQMTIPAANAFLKTMEEPAGKSLIILITPELSRILPTIASRAVSLHFKNIQQDEMAEFLRGKGARDVKILSDVSYGRPGRAMKLMENGEWQKASRSAVKEFYNLFFAHPADRFRIANQIFGGKKGGGKDLLSRRIDFWLELVRDAIFIKYGLNDAVAHSYGYADLDRVAAAQSAGQLSSLGCRLIKMRELLGRNINPQMMLENLII
jgi:DNA polymerase-3 subunit delta'